MKLIHFLKIMAMSQRDTTEKSRPLPSRHLQQSNVYQFPTKQICHVHKSSKPNGFSSQTNKRQVLRTDRTLQKIIELASTLPMYYSRPIYLAAINAKSSIEIDSRR